MTHETLRTTPRWIYGRDVVLFPEAQQAQRECGCPRHHFVRVTRSRIRFAFDMLFLPPDIEAALDRLYRNYLEWWLAKGNPARRRFPSDGLSISRPFYRGVGNCDFRCTISHSLTKVKFDVIRGEHLTFKLVFPLSRVVLSLPK